jgi:hypothetical protein
VVVTATHGLIEDLDGEHVVTVVLENNKVPDVDGVHTGKVLSAIMEEHMPFAARHTQYDAIGLWPIND